MKKLESSFKNMVLVLTGVTVIATSLLAYINMLTKPAIDATNAQTLENAIKIVVPAFDNNPVKEAKIVGEYTIYPAKKEGTFVGAAVKTASNGFGGTISLLVGFDHEGNIIDYSVLSHSETPGLGSKMETWFKTEKQAGAATEQSFLSKLFFGAPKASDGNQNIKGMNPGKAPLTVSKDGGNVDAITASTITSRAFLKAINNAYNAYAGNDAKSGATEQINQ